MDYADVADLHAYGNFTTETDDTLLDTMISAASAIVDNFCGRVFALDATAAPTVRTYTLDNGMLPIAGRTLWLHEDLQSVASISTLTGTPIPTLTQLPDAPPYDRIVRSDGVWENPTTVLAYWAYSLVPPAPVKYAAIRLALWLYRQRDSTDSDRPVLMDGMVIMPAKLPEDIIAILSPYRRVRLP